MKKFFTAFVFIISNNDANSSASCKKTLPGVAAVDARKT